MLGFRSVWLRRSSWRHGWFGSTCHRQRCARRARPARPERPDRVYLNGYLAGCRSVGRWCSSYGTAGSRCLHRRACSRSATHSAVRLPPTPTLTTSRWLSKSTHRNIDLMRRYLDSAARQRRSQVAAIGVAQEPQRVFIAGQRDTDPTKPPQFSFDKKDRRVTVFYFYLWDADFGPAFVKVCTYCPWPIKVWVNETNGPNATPPKRVWSSPSCPTGSPPARIPKRCKGSATVRPRPDQRVLPALAVSAPAAAHPR